MKDTSVVRMSVNQTLGINLAQASAVIDGALAHARATGLAPMTVTVLDCAGRPVAMKREDGSSLLRPDIAHAKAFGALAMGMGSRALGERAATHPAFVASITALAQGNLVPVAGGVLIRDAGGALLGAIGISGALPDQDEACAVEALSKCGLQAQIAGTH